MSLFFLQQECHILNPGSHPSHDGPVVEFKKKKKISDYYRVVLLNGSISSVRLPLAIIGKVEFPKSHHLVLIGQMV